MARGIAANVRSALLIDAHIVDQKMTWEDELTPLWSLKGIGNSQINVDGLLDDSEGVRLDAKISERRNLPWALEKSNAEKSRQACWDRWLKP